MRLEEKTALVNGVNIGCALAITSPNMHADVVIVDLHVSAATKVAEEIRLLASKAYEREQRGWQ